MLISKETLKAYYCWLPTDTPITIEVIDKIIDQIPEAEEKRGRWETVMEFPVTDDNWNVIHDCKCSECGRWSRFLQMPGETAYDYCPNCGAKMDESTMGQVKPSDRERKEDA